MSSFVVVLLASNAAASPCSFDVTEPVGNFLLGTAVEARWTSFGICSSTVNVRLHRTVAGTGSDPVVSPIEAPGPNDGAVPDIVLDPGLLSPGVEYHVCVSEAGVALPGGDCAPPFTVHDCELTVDGPSGTSAQGDAVTGTWHQAGSCAPQVDVRVRRWVSGTEADPLVATVEAPGPNDGSVPGIVLAPALFPAGGYHLCVNEASVAEPAGDCGPRFDVVTPANRAPGAFSKQSPTDGVGLSGRVTFQWGSSTDPDGDAVRYDFVLNDADGTSVCSVSGTASRTASCDLPPVSGADFYWQVWATDGRGAWTEADGGAWWQVWNDLPVNEPPLPFSLVAPADDTGVLGSDVAFQWTEPVDPDGDAITSTVVVNDDRGTELARSAPVSGTSTTLALPVADGEHVFWTVEATDAVGHVTQAAEWRHLWVERDSRGLTYGYDPTCPVTQGFGDYDCIDEVPRQHHMGEDCGLVGSQRVTNPFRRTVIHDLSPTDDGGLGIWALLEHEADPGEVFYLPDGTTTARLRTLVGHCDRLVLEAPDSTPIDPYAVVEDVTRVGPYADVCVPGDSGFAIGAHTHNVGAVATIEAATLADLSYTRTQSLGTARGVYNPRELADLNAEHPANPLDLYVVVHSTDLDDVGTTLLTLDGPWESDAQDCITSGGYNGYWHVAPGDAPSTATARFNLPLAGRWEISAFVPSQQGTHPAVEYQVRSTRGDHEVVSLDQLAWSDEFASLGAFELDAGISATVVVTFDPDPGTQVSVDAFRARYLGPLGGAGVVRARPVLDAPASIGVGAGGTAVFQVRASDADTPLRDLTFSVDGAPGATITPIGAGAARVSYTPASLGVHTLHVTASDGQGSDTERVEVEVGSGVGVSGSPGPDGWVMARAWGATPHGDVVFLLSSTGPGVGPCVPSGAWCAGVLAPSVARATASAEGTAVMPMRTASPGVWLQAVATTDAGPAASGVVAVTSGGPIADADQDGLEDGVEDLLIAPYQGGAACIADSLFSGPGPYAVAGYPLGWTWSAANVGDARLPGFTCVDLAAFPAYEVSWTSPTGEWADITPFCEGTTEPACEWTAGGWLFRFEVTAGQLYPTGRQDLVPSGADGDGDGIDDTFDHLQVDPVDPFLVCVSRAAVGAHDPGPWSVVGDRWGWSFDASRVALDDGSWLCHREVTDGSVGFALLSLDGGWVDLGQGCFEQRDPLCSLRGDGSYEVGATWTGGWASPILGDE